MWLLDLFQEFWFLQLSTAETFACWARMPNLPFVTSEQIGR